MSKSKYVTETIRLPADVKAACEARAKRMGVSLGDFVVYIVMRTVDDYNLALDASAAAAAARQAP